MEPIILLLGVGLIIGGFFVSGILAPIMFIVGGGCVGYFVGIVHFASAIFSRW